MLLQYESYLKGFYFHSTVNQEGVVNIKEAVRWYTHSLNCAEEMSINYWRLQALENIELIISEEA